MPNLRGIYQINPLTSESGLWVMLANGNVLGRTDAQIAAMVGTGNVATRTARFIAAATAWFQAQFEESTPLSSFDAARQTELIATPPPFCRIVGSDLVAQASVVSFTVISLSPLRYEITVSNGAAGVETVYG